MSHLLLYAICGYVFSLLSCQHYLNSCIDFQPVLCHNNFMLPCFLQDCQKFMWLWFCSFHTCWREWLGRLGDATSLLSMHNFLKWNPHFVLLWEQPWSLLSFCVLTAITWVSMETHVSAELSCRNNAFTLPHAWSQISRPFVIGKTIL